MSITFKVVSAQLTRDTETFSNMDPYCVLELGNSKQRTTTKDQAGKRPVWNQQFRFNTASNSLKVTVMDEDTFSDDTVGTGTLDLAKFRNINQQVKQYVPLNYKGKNAGQVLLMFEPSANNGGMQYPNIGQATQNNQNQWGQQQPNQYGQKQPNQWGQQQPQQQQQQQNQWSQQPNQWNQQQQPNQWNQQQGQQGWGNQNGWGQQQAQNNNGWGNQQYQNPPLMNDYVKGVFQLGNQNPPPYQAQQQQVDPSFALKGLFGGSFNNNPQNVPINQNSPTKELVSGMAGLIQKQQQQGQGNPYQTNPYQQGQSGW